jgi:hypothetical protein
MFAAHGKPIGVYRRGWLAWLISGCFVVMGLVFGAGLSDPHFGWKVFGGVMAALCIGYAYVTWRAATVVLYANGALVGTPVRPRWIPWDEVRDVSLEPDQNLWSRRGHVPVIQLKSSRSLKLGFFFVPESSGSNGDIAQRVADALKAQTYPNIG